MVSKGMEFRRFLEILQAEDQLETVTDSIKCSDIPAYVTAEESAQNSVV
jgi:hypothetical protein